MPRVLAIDPGPALSAYVVYQPPLPPLFGKVSNEDLRQLIHDTAPDGTLGLMAIEYISSMGMAVGQEVFDTCVWCGRFIEAWVSTRPGPAGAQWFPVKRHAVKMHLCGSMQAKDANIRQALIDRYGGHASHKKGGPLYKLSGDCWSALAIAVTFVNQLNQRPTRGTSPAGEVHA